MVKMRIILCFKYLFIIVLIGSLFLLSGNTIHSASPSQKKGIQRFKGITKWKGKIHYKLDYKDEIGDAGTSFLKMKGLQGKTLQTIVFEGEVTFNSAGGNSIFVGRGNVKYSISLISVSSLGEAFVVHLTDGKGSAKIEPIRPINYLEFHFSDGSYSLRITPGSSDEELDAFGVEVETFSKIKVTRALIKKMEEEGRPLLYPGVLKSMFSDQDTNRDLENIAAEAFGIAFPSSGYTLKGSYKDDKGGIFSWDFVPGN